MSTAPIRVLVVDDHPIVRGGIVAALANEPDFEVVGEAGDGVAALEQVARLDPDVVLMDLRMPTMDGVTATRSIRESYPRTVVVVLTTYESDDDILSAIEAGATGYLLKAVPRTELVAGIRSAAQGQVALAPAVATALVRGYSAPPPVTLSPREVEVLALVARGHTNAEVAGELFISQATVKTHLVRIFEKLGVSDRTRAVTLALDKGLISVPR